MLLIFIILTTDLSQSKWLINDSWINDYANSLVCQMNIPKTWSQGNYMGRMFHISLLIIVPYKLTDQTLGQKFIQTFKCRVKQVILKKFLIDF